ncbi:XrtB/PEP-CTERM-associated polysaccharide biosynthesis outer membrane protein EpsL [Ramlibacter sp.]|uniref:XrtB/PEP-CTERM-associated polysaccharide biosynthesis outer membrane protein EpsL n=1 Tax=Ramlibacter sp. TaxID=1917967 RepID=UPI002D25DB78|nr:XrtB/PEP-CTERM-associated polysaccharide biosynthesis outer membrane protein EpsL [Ramlibacter sp.]HYD77128.1 XrtB/PEP-CTERM-associated polysaccharide biosynthesis outer membrane protein EpsL [Ramlibacter sp.]
MKKPSLRPVLTAVAAATCLLPMALQAQTTLQAPGGRLGESAAQPAGQSMGTPMGESMAVPMVVPMSPAQAISQPYSPVSSGADQREGIQFRAMAGVERDDNVLRTNGGEISDTITGLGLGLRYQKRVSRQQFVVDAEVNHFNFDKIGVDYNTLNYSAAWQWAAGERFEGILSADRRQFRDVTSNGVAAGIDRRTERNELFEGGYKLGASWRVLGGLQHNASRSSDPAAWDANLSQNSVRVGVAYEPATGSSLALRFRRGDGDYDNAPVASDFDDNEIEASMRWIVSPKTRVDARLGHLEREHSGAPTRDFSGVVGSVGVNWDITGKTSLTAGYARDLGSYLFGTGGHLSSDRWFVGPTWRATDLITVNLRYEHETRHWEDVTGSLDVGRKDKFNVGTLGVEWAVRRSVTLGAQYRHERRSSSLPVFNYRANVIGLTAKLTI